ncbi:toll/interleukin-1 receptor domain-containing protein [Micromonospora sp. NPDC047134]|uniref:toll/interleukin-1 receptor domain-containing protein n=1 Tax=Micromonospora sp. NPDC047134 TaxID=3154340 RepID=UPI0033E728E7
MTDLLLPTPGQWIHAALTQRKMTVRALSKAVGYPRPAVHRWVSGHTPIPRRVIGDLAAEIGRPGDLEHLLTLKSAEENLHQLRRTMTALAHLAHCPAEELTTTVLDFVAARAADEIIASDRDRAGAVNRHLIDASYVFRQWTRAASTGDFRALLTPSTIHRHLRYPVNHYLGLALALGETGGDQLAEHRRLALTALRAVAVPKPHGRWDLLQHHALHVLARNGTAENRATVSEVISNAAPGKGSLCRQLGYVGLILSSGGEEALHRYLFLLRRCSKLTRADLHFDAVHYGDARLDARQRLPQSINQFDRSVGNLLRHLEQPDRYASISELDSLRLLTLLDRLGPTLFQRPEIGFRLRRVFQSSPAPPPNSYRSRLENRLFGILRHTRTQPTAPPARVTPNPAQYDVFIGYHSADAASVRLVVDALRSANVQTWFDLDDLPPGTPFQVALEQALRICRSVALFIGPTGIGPWEAMEVRAAISQFVDRGLPVIPVVLGELDWKPELPLFLREFRAVQLRSHTDIDDLVWGITGQRRPAGARSIAAAPHWAARPPKRRSRGGRRAALPHDPAEQLDLAS